MKILAIILFALFIMTLNTYSQTDPDKDVLKKVDSEFSDYSKLYGAKEAFIKYIDDACVVIKRNNYPLVGKDKVIAVLFDGDKNDYTLTWTPLFADIAQSGEIGYTYGTWNLDSKDEKGNRENSKGTYITIWKKESDGSWKYVFDAGNSGLEPPKK